MTKTIHRLRRMRWNAAAEITQEFLGEILLRHFAAKVSFTVTLSLNLTHGIRGKYGRTGGNKPVFGKLPLVSFSVFLVPSINSDL